MLYFLDCEASSLSHKSYPIEIAWSDQQGNIESHLINTNEYPENYTDWDPEAEKIHGLSQEYLYEKGKSPLHVANCLNEALKNKTVYTDASDFDKFWCDRLFSACNLKREFNFGEMDKLLKQLLPDQFSYINYFTGYNQIDELKQQARIECGLDAHRASNDVAYLIKLYNLAKAVSIQ